MRHSRARSIRAHHKCSRGPWRPGDADARARPCPLLSSRAPIRSSADKPCPCVANAPRRAQCLFGTRAHGPSAHFHIASLVQSHLRAGTRDTARRQYVLGLVKRRGGENACVGNASSSAAAAYHLSPLAWVDGSRRKAAATELTPYMKSAIASQRAELEREVLAEERAAVSHNQRRILRTQRSM